MPTMLSLAGVAYEKVTPGNTVLAGTSAGFVTDQALAICASSQSSHGSQVLRSPKSRSVRSTAAVELLFGQVTMGRRSCDAGMDV